MAGSFTQPMTNHNEVLDQMEYHLPRHRDRRAFSLMELLVTVAIVAVVMAIAIPVVHKLQDSSKSIACLSNLRAYGSGLLAYAADNRSFPWWDGNSTRNLGPGAVKPNFELWLRPYLHLSEEARLRCPLKGKTDTGFNYSGNGALCLHFPTLKGIPAPAPRVVLAAESVAADGFYHSVHFNMTMWGLNETNSYVNGEDFKNMPQIRKPQYHGPSDARGLHLFFLDGHAALIRPAKGDWREEPTFGSATNGGYFYEKNQFRDMKRYPERY